MKICSTLGWLCAGLLFSGLLQADERNPTLDAGQIGQRLDRLAVLGSVLYIAAHPDDENTQLLAWLSQARHYRTAYLSLTRGDGGQNLLGNEQGESLGLIRTHELLEARGVDGASQLFSRARDFGFSKTSDETLKVWDKEQVLADVVWAIRRFQPDVIITRFPGDSRAGHGHHQASSLLAQEAFRAAANPQLFPEQLKYVKPWQAKRLLWNTWKSFLGSGDTTEPGQLRIDIGGYNPRLGSSYGEVAALSRNNHKSQGFGSAAQRGRLWESFALLDGEPAETQLLDGIDTQWSRLPDTLAIAARIETLRHDYDSAAPAASVPGLLQLRSQLLALPAGLWRERKLEEVETLVLAAAGVWVETSADAPQYPLGQTIPVRTDVLVRSAVPVSVLDAGRLQALPANEVVPVAGAVKPLHISQPYWLVKAHSQGMFTVDQQTLIGEPRVAHAPQVTTVLHIAGQTFEVQRDILYKAVDPLRGEVYRPVQVTPAVTATPVGNAYLFGDANSRPVEIRLHAFAGSVSGVLRPRVPEGWRVSPASQAFTLDKYDEEKTLSFALTPTSSAKNGTLNAEVVISGETSSYARASIDYPHIPRFDWFPSAETVLTHVDLRRGSQRIGYIAGAGDRLPEILRQLGYSVDELDIATLESHPLGDYDAIVTGVRAYNVHPQLDALRSKLLDYVQQGGVFLVQYNTQTPLPGELGPYPFTITRDRVTEENSEVRLLLPEHPLLNIPNTITAQDFDGWVQERGLYFAQNIDPRYQRLLAMHDSGEQEQTGSLISADVGKGRFIYAPLSFFRQLPAGVPGAARLLANLLARP